MPESDGDALFEAASKIVTHEDFLVFLRMLHSNFCNHPQEWDNNTFPDYFDAMFRFAESMDGYYANCAPDIDSRVPSWRVFADLLLAAKVYE